MKTNHNAIPHEEDQSLYVCHYVISYDVIAYNHYVIEISHIKETYHKVSLMMNTNHNLILYDVNQSSWDPL